MQRAINGSPNSQWVPDWANNYSVGNGNMGSGDYTLYDGLGLPWSYITAVQSSGSHLPCTLNTTQEMKINYSDDLGPSPRTRTGDVDGVVAEKTRAERYVVGHIAADIRAVKHHRTDPRSPVADTGRLRTRVGIRYGVTEDGHQRSAIIRNRACTHWEHAPRASGSDSPEISVSPYGSG